jgi:hypothetical protein
MFLYVLNIEYLKCLIFTNTRHTRTGHGGYKQYPTHPFANKDNSIRVQEENLGKEHTHWLTSTRIGKRDTPTKEEIFLTPT